MQERALMYQKLSGTQGNVSFSFNTLFHIALLNWPLLKIETLCDIMQCTTMQRFLANNSPKSITIA